MVLKWFKPSAQLELTFAIISAIFIALGFSLQAIQPTHEGWVRGLFGLSFLIGGYFKAVEGVTLTLENKALNVEILMIMAALGAFITGNFSEGAILILIFSISGALESYTVQKSKSALTALLNLAPQEALLWSGGEEHIVKVEDLKVGDIVIVKVGDQVPVDGIITQGHTTLDEANITGESMPVEKKVKDFVYASTLNESSVIKVQCAKDPKESTVQKIIDFVSEAQEDQPKIQNRVDWIEKVYVYFVILLAISFMTIPPIFNIWTQDEAIYRGIIVLVVGSPCALVASISPAVLATISHASRKKILIKGGSKLEGLSDIRCVIFDKTGTLTKGQPTVQFSWQNPDKADLLPIFIGMENASNHPLALAIVKTFHAVTPHKVTPQEIPGKGLEYATNGHRYQVGKFNTDYPDDVQKMVDDLTEKGQSIVVFYEDEIPVGLIGISDEIKEEAKSLIQFFKAKNIHTIMVSGDLEKTAQKIGKELGMDEIHAQCLPEDKVKWVKHYQSQYQKVMMIGDGINDAPALAISDVAIAMGSGTDVSLESSDIVLMESQLGSIELTFKLAQRLQRIIGTNVIFSVGVIALLLTFNTLGWVLLPLGVLVHELSTILVVLNGLRMMV